MVQRPDSEEAPGYKLTQGDVIKLGRVKLIVRKLQPQNEESSCIQDATCAELSVATEDKECKICYDNFNTQENPLVSPCNCSGTAKYIHLECLKKCLGSKKKSRSREGTFSSSWDKICCELCASRLPIFMNLNSTQVNLLETDAEKYDAMIVLEYIDSGNVSGVHMITLTEGSVANLGRGHDCDARVADISVSRFHANITYKNGEFILKDNKSKFGTLVQIKDMIEIQPCQNAVVQCGRTLLKIKLQKRGEIIDSGVQTIDEDQATSVPEGSPQW